MKKLVLLLGVGTMLFGLGLVDSATAGEDLTVSFATYRRGHYMAPINNIIVVGDRPFPFYVVVKNTDERATEIYEKKGGVNVRHLEFEFTDAKGVKTIVKHKDAPSARERGGYRMMQPDELQVASVLLNSEEWTMSASIPVDKDSEWGLRVIYVNGDKKVYSALYKVTIKAL